MSNATMSREDLTAHKHKLAAERAATIAGLPANPGPPVAPPSYGPAFPQPAFKPVAEPAKPRGVPVVSEGLTADCIAADAKYNEGVAAWYAEAEKHESAKAHRFDEAATVTVAELAKRRDSINGSELTLAQKAVVLHSEYVDREAARAAELKVHAEGCEEGLAAVVESVTKRLNATGISVESQPNYAANPNSAEIAFSHLVFQSVDWRDANQKLSEARATHQMTVEAVTAGRAQLAKAEAYLATVVRKLAA